MVHSLDSVGCNFVGAWNMSNAELVVGGCRYRVSMADKGDSAGQGLKGMGGVEVSRVSMKTMDARKKEGKTTDVESTQAQVAVKEGEG